MASNVDSCCRYEVGKREEREAIETEMPSETTEEPKEEQLLDYGEVEAEENEQGRNDDDIYDDYYDDEDDDEEYDDENNQLLLQDLRHHHRVISDLWSLVPAVNPLDRSVSLDGQYYRCLPMYPGNLIFQAKASGGFRGYAPLLLKNEALFLWHTTETVLKSNKEGSPTDHREGEEEEEDCVTPTTNSSSLVKIGECKGKDKREFHCYYHLTNGLVPLEVFEKAVERLRYTFGCTLEEKCTLRIYNMQTELSGVEYKENNVFQEIEPFRQFYYFNIAVMYADWKTIKKHVLKRRQERLGTDSGDEKKEEKGGKNEKEAEAEEEKEEEEEEEKEGKEEEKKEGKEEEKEGKAMQEPVEAKKEEQQQEEEEEEKDDCYESEEELFLREPVFKKKKVNP